jgi:hypothetical protein
MYDEPPRESARARAARIWWNNHVIKQTQQNKDPLTTTPPRQIKALIRDILSNMIISNNEIIKQYNIVLNERRRRLLKEKLKRLQENNDE